MERFLLIRRNAVPLFFKYKRLLIAISSSSRLPWSIPLFLLLFSFFPDAFFRFLSIVHCHGRHLGNVSFFQRGERRQQQRWRQSIKDECALRKLLKNVSRVIRTMLSMNPTYSKWTAAAARIKIYYVYKKKRQNRRFFPTFFSSFSSRSPEDGLFPKLFLWLSFFSFFVRMEPRQKSCLFAWKRAKPCLVIDSKKKSGLAFLKVCCLSSTMRLMLSCEIFGWVICHLLSRNGDSISEFGPVLAPQ